MFEKVPGGCRISFYVDFEFKSRLMQKLIEVLFSEAVRRMVGAFENRARDLYGAPLPGELVGQQSDTAKQRAIPADARRQLSPRVRGQL
jgi:hypothetical protein